MESREADQIPYSDKEQTVEEKPKRAIDSLNPRRRAFVENYTNPSSPTFSNATQSLSAVAPDLTYSSTRELASRELTKVDTQLAIRERLDELYAADGGPELWAHSHLRRFAADSDEPWKRSPAVRSIELVMKATGQLQDTTVTVDARSILLPGANNLSEEQLLALLQATETADNP